MFALVDGSPYTSIRSCYGLGDAGAYGETMEIVNSKYRKTNHI